MQQFIHRHPANRQLYVAFSTDGGKDYRRTNGNLRRYPVVGIPNLGMSLDICAGRVWAATAYRSATDKPRDSDVFLTSRTVGGGAAQALMTSTSDDRRVRDATVTCVGGDLIAIGGNHFIHAARRNIDLTVILMNNSIYGMTGGQAGPTTPLGARGTTAPYGNPELPFNLPYLLTAAGANLVGGCCRIGPEQIAAMSRSITNSG